MDGDAAVDGGDPGAVTQNDAGESLDTGTTLPDPTSTDAGTTTTHSNDAGHLVGSTPDATADATGTDAHVSTPVDSGSHPVVDAGIPDTSVATSEDTGVVTTSCGGVPAWVSGTTAQEVQNGGSKYKCLVPGWCDQTGVSAVDAWEPGVGSAWSQAWSLEGPCQ